MAILPRLLTARLKEALLDTPAILITGPRQCGKSTLAAQFVPPSAIFTLDDSALRSSALEDPQGFVDRLPALALIDEIQRAPALLLALKAAIDRDRRPGRILMTGSANVMNFPQVEESLAGRVELLSLSPFSQAELAENAVDLIERLFAGQIQLGATLTEPQIPLLERIHRGGFPEVQTREEHRQARWFSSYISTLLERDIRDINQIQNLRVLPRLLQQVAAQSAGTLNAADLARTLGLNASTFARYLDSLELLFLLVRLPAWSSNRLKRLAKMPKLHLTDTGLACAVLGLSAAGLERDRLWGALLESFVVLELLRHLDSSVVQARAYHLRTHDQIEVDLILERADLGLVGVEVKASSTVQSKDFKGLRTLQTEEEERFVGGYVFYGGNQVLPFGPQLLAVPLSWLWQAS